MGEGVAAVWFVVGEGVAAVWFVGGEGVAAVSFSVTHQSIFKRNIIYFPITDHKGADLEDMITGRQGG